MADKLGERVLQLFVCKQNTPLPLHDILHELKCNKKQLNQSLYAFQRKNILQKIQEAPPIWALTSQGLNQHDETGGGGYVPSGDAGGVGTPTSSFNFAGDVYNSHSKSVMQFTAQRGPSKATSKDVRLECPDTGEKIFRLLKDTKGPYKTHYIASVIGHANQSTVSRILHQLKRRQLVIQASSMPPSWKIHPNATDDAFVELSEQVSDESNTDMLIQPERCRQDVASVPPPPRLIHQPNNESISTQLPESAAYSKVSEPVPLAPIPNLASQEDFTVAPQCHIQLGPRKDEISAEIMKILRDANGRAVRTMTIAQSVGKRSEREINPILFKLKRQNLAVQYSKQPPCWKIHPKALEVEGDEAPPCGMSERVSTPPSALKTSNMETNAVSDVTSDISVVIDPCPSIDSERYMPVTEAAMDEDNDRKDVVADDVEMADDIADDADSDKMSAANVQNAVDSTCSESFIRNSNVALLTDNVNDVNMDESVNSETRLKQPIKIPSGNAVLMAMEKHSQVKKFKNMEYVPISDTPELLYHSSLQTSNQNTMQGVKQDGHNNKPYGRGAAKFCNEPRLQNKRLPTPPHLLQNQESELPPASFGRGRGRGRIKGRYFGEEVNPLFNVHLLPYTKTIHTEVRSIPNDESYDAIPETGRYNTANVMIGGEVKNVNIQSKNSQGYMNSTRGIDVQGHMNSTRGMDVGKGFKPPPSPLDLIRGQTHFSNVLDDQNKLLAGLQSRETSEFRTSTVQPLLTMHIPRAPSPVTTSNSQFSNNSIPSSGYQEQKFVNTSMGLNSASMGNKNLISALNSNTFNFMNKSPISALTEFAQSHSLKLSIDVIGQSGPPHKPKFQLMVTLGTRHFSPITSSNKKEGRKEAADAALRQLMADGKFTPQQGAAQVSHSVQLLASTVTHFDRMAALSHQAMNVLAANISDSISGRKVLAALIMKRSPEDEGSVISLGTGNRCITGPQMSQEGTTVNDSHAEVITRRGFIRFLYRQLLHYVPNDDSFIIERTGNGRFKVKDGITFHLYISTAPCGDGALFSPRDVAGSVAKSDDNRKDHNPTIENALQGILRSKIEGGEGTIHIESDAVTQTWDGIQLGERLRTMSCSDKVCRWNILGLQGALLTLFLEPIYMSSLTLGYLYDHGHLSRAVCCRLAVGDPPITESIPSGYRLNHPHLGRVTVYEPQRGTEKTKAVGLNWCAGDQQAEVTDGTTGQVVDRNLSMKVSRVAKQKFFDSFKKICIKYERTELFNGLNYYEAKQNSEDFQRLKKNLMVYFKKNKLSEWVQKPIEEKMFI